MLFRGQSLEKVHRARLQKYFYRQPLSRFIGSRSSNISIFNTQVAQHTHISTFSVVFITLSVTEQKQIARWMVHMPTPTQGRSGFGSLWKIDTFGMTHSSLSHPNSISLCPSCTSAFAVIILILFVYSLSSLSVFFFPLIEEKALWKIRLPYWVEKHLCTFLFIAVSLPLPHSSFQFCFGLRQMTLSPSLRLPLSLLICTHYYCWPLLANLQTLNTPSVAQNTQLCRLDFSFPELNWSRIEEWHYSSELKQCIVSGGTLEMFKRFKPVFVLFNRKRLALFCTFCFP